MDRDDSEALIPEAYSSRSRHCGSTRNGIPIHQRKSPTWLLPMSSLVAALGGLLFGYDTGIISGAVLLIEKEFMLSSFQKELIVTMLLVGALVGSVTGGYLLDHFGRKWTIIGNAGIFLLGAAGMTFCSSYPILIVGRLVLGFAVALSAVGDCVYISEIAPPDKRGFLVSLNELGITIGILLAYLVNYLFINTNSGWRYMFGLSAIPAIIQGVGMWFLPGSPRWMLTKGKEAQAEALIKILWPHLDSQTELNRMKAVLSSEQGYSIYHLFTKRENLRLRMFIGCGVVFFQQLTGQPTVLVYAPILFQSLGFSGRTAATLATVGLGVVKVLFTLITLMSVDRLGRRTFLITGAVIMTISLIILAAVTEPLHDMKKYSAVMTTFVPTVLPSSNNSRITTASASSIARATSTIPLSHNVVNEVKTLPNALKYTCLSSLMAFVIGYAVGYGPMSWLILTEIFPTGIKGRAASIATSVNWGVYIVISLTFLDVLDSFGPFWTFFAYSMVGVIAILFVCHFVPETKGKSLEKISEILSKRKIGCAAVKCCRNGQVLVVENTEEDVLLAADDLIMENDDLNESLI